ncbi:hypothetical protein DM01DRAFT_1340693, partial [Hesseltinella vesiculosa]
MDKVEQICSKNGIQFIHHIDIHDCSWIGAVQESIDELDLCIKNLEKERDVQSKSARIATASLSDLGKNMKDKLTRGYGTKGSNKNVMTTSRPSAFSRSKTEAIMAKHDILDKLAEKRKMKYLHQKEQSDKSAAKKPAKAMDKQPPPPPTVLTPTTRTEEDPCETEIGTVDLEHT